MTTIADITSQKTRLSCVAATVQTIATQSARARENKDTKQPKMTIGLKGMSIQHEQKHPKQLWFVYILRGVFFTDLGENEALVPPLLPPSQ